jgi:methyl-accepting chemotaxis protein
MWPAGILTFPQFGAFEARVMSFLKRWSFNRLSLNARVVLVVVVVIAGLTGLTVMNAFESRARQMEGLERTLSSEIQAAISVATAYEKRATAGEFSDAEARRLALRDIEAMRWDGGTGYIFAFDSGMTMRMHPLKKDLVGKNIARETDARGKPHYRLMAEGNLENGHTLIRYTQIMPDGSGKDKITYSQLFKPWGLNFCAGAYFDDIDAQFRHSLEVNLAKAAAVGLLVILMVWLSMRSIRRSIGGEPDFAVKMASRIADGDLTVEDGNGNFAGGSLLDALARMRARITGIVGEVQHGSQAVSTAARQIAKGNDDLSQRTQEQASSLEETAASMEEMTSTVKQNAENASYANQLAGGAREQAERGGEVAARAVEAMGEINASSRKIADIVGLIDEIAFQTNLLSLNAAVEAARAGEQGRGVAVVASEVRSRSQRSAAAAREIKGLIIESVQRVQAGSVLVDESGAALAGIVDSVKKVTDIVAEIAAASQEQSSGIDQVNRAVMQMDEVTQQNAALVEEAAAAARAMQEQANELQRQMTFFRLGESATRPASVTAPQRPRAAVAPRRTAAAVAAGAATSTAGAWTEF